MALPPQPGLLLSPAPSTSHRAKDTAHPFNLGGKSLLGHPFRLPPSSGWQRWLQPASSRGGSAPDGWDLLAPGSASPLPWQWQDIAFLLLLLCAQSQPLAPALMCGAYQAPLAALRARLASHEGAAGAGAASSLSSSFPTAGKPSPYTPLSPSSSSLLLAALSSSSRC